MLRTAFGTHSRVLTRRNRLSEKSGGRFSLATTSESAYTFSGTCEICGTCGICEIRGINRLCRGGGTSEGKTVGKGRRQLEKIYIIEDDQNIRNLLKIAVSGFQYEPFVFENAEDALKQIGTDLPDMAIFDLMLPGMDGITAIRKIRQMPEVSGIPILILTAKDKELDKVIGLDGGADDYMVKPFGVLELGARIRSLLRRGGKTAEETAGKERKADLHSSDTAENEAASDGSRSAAETEKGEKKLVYKGIVLDEARHEVKADGKAVELTNKEYKLLRYLMERPSFVATRDALLNSIWGYEYDGESRTVDMHIKSLRQKLGDEEGELIQTVRGIGYKLK